MYFQGFRIPQDAQYDDIEALKDSLILSDNAREFIGIHPHQIAKLYPGVRIWVTFSRI